MMDGRVRRILRAVAALLALSILALSPALHASIAYGSINNFDAVNDNGVPCHGFEIEIDGIHSTDITYTYDWNHYGVPRITEDGTDPLRPKVFVRYESAKNPDGTWAAYTAVPAAAISPTDGHQFTDPSVNFGGEHFGVGFYGTPSAVMYNWLIDDGSGRLIHGGAVNIATPVFTYFPPVNAAPAQVQAVIVPPPPPAPPLLEFGEASWVKETKTSSHNNGRVELRDLVSDDPNDPNDRNWQNGEAAEVEVEWQLSQTEFKAADGGPNGVMAGVPEDLPNGDEIITRRYDFFKYVGPIDAETGEALADAVGPDDSHGVGIKTINGEEVDLSTIVVVGDYVGAQMAGFDPGGQIGLIDHLQDGETNFPYVDRTVVVGGTPPVETTTTGALPDGMDFNLVTGVLSGTPRGSGAFALTVHSVDAVGGEATRAYTLTIADPGFAPLPHSTVTTGAAPAEGGSSAGDGEYVNGTNVTVSASAYPGFAFTGWTDGGTVVSTELEFSFIAEVNRRLVATFVPTYNLTYLAGEHGSINGPTPQTVEQAGTGAAVSSEPAPGWCFLRWDDTVLDNPRCDTGVTADLSVTALYRAANTVPPSGRFEALVDAADVQAGRGLWDLTGTYRATIAGNQLVMNIKQDGGDRVTGTATCTLAKATVVTMPIRGSVRGAAGKVMLKGVLAGTDAGKTVSLALALHLTVNTADRQIVGRISGSIRKGGVTTPVSADVAPLISTGMNGTWTLRFQLDQTARGIGGSAELTLSNGVLQTFVVQGKLRGAKAALSLTAYPSAGLLKAIGIRATVAPLEDGSARLESFAVRGYGQAVAW